MEAYMSFLGNNRKEVVNYFRNSGVLAPRGQFPSLLKMQKDGTITDEQLLECAITLGFNPDAPEQQEEQTVVSVPTNVTVLKHQAKDGSVVQYGLLPFLRWSNSHKYAVCQYGNVELFVALGDKVANLWGFKARMEGRDMSNELIPATLSSSKIITENGTYIRGLRKNSEGVMKGLWETSFLASVHEGCQAIIEEQSQAFTYNDRITAVMHTQDVDKPRAIEIVKAEQERGGAEIVKAMSSKSTLASLILSQNNG
jgi:hypothetical protein